MTSFCTKLASIGKFLIGVYITQPWVKDKMRFTNYYSLVAIFSVITLLQINFLLYPVPELSELSKAEGTLVKVDDNTGGRYSSLSVTVLTMNNEQVDIVVSTRKKSVKFYQQNVGKPIKIWYRWSMSHNLVRQVFINGSIRSSYSKEKELKNSYIPRIFLYITAPLWLYTLLKPWFFLVTRQLKNSPHKK
jgi:hypothetical protein